MGGGNSKDQYALPKDVQQYTDIKDDRKKLKKAVGKYQSVVLEGKDMRDVDLYEKIIGEATFRKIVMRSFEEVTKEDRERILQAFACNPDHPWTFRRILRHPTRYRKRVQRILEIDSYATVVEDAHYITTMIASNHIQRMNLTNSGLRGQTLSNILHGAVHVISINLSGNRFEMEEASILKTYISLRSYSEVVLRECCEQEAVTEEIVAGFNGSEKQISLDLSGNAIGHKTVDWIEERIKSKKLKTLVLNKIDLCQAFVLRILRQPKWVSKVKSKFKVLRTVIEMSSTDGPEVTQNASTSRRSLQGSKSDSANNRREGLTRTHQAARTKRIYDMTLRRGQNAIYCILDEESQATGRYPEVSNNPIVLSKIPIEVPVGSRLSATLHCQGKQTISTSPKEFTQKSLQRNRCFILRFDFEDPGVRRLSFELKIRDEREIISIEKFTLTWPWSPTAGCQGCLNKVEINNPRAPVSVTGPNVNAENILNHGGRIDSLNLDTKSNIGTT